ncbi:MAG TPA: nuclear transport factor 2 family protein [Acidimicrobiales bacterium]|nr:nuclear transport factor 2 family protein [Acidimicrobiales bacterium]
MTVEKLRRCFETGAWERLTEVYAPDALLDANVPQWRFQCKGVDQITAQYRAWYPASVRIAEWRPTLTAFGAVVEQAEWAGDGADEVFARSVHLLHLERDRIVRHVLYCTGQWDRATVERQALEAPMYQP